MCHYVRKFRQSLKAATLALATLSVISAPALAFAKPAQAAPATATGRWAHQGVAILPRNANDFGSQQMKTSLADLAATGANEVLLVVPLQQADLNSCQIYANNETPSMASLATATKEAHDLGMKVILKFHSEINDQTWRTFINATDRNCWYTNYGNAMISYLKGSNGADGAVIGTEMHGMFGTSANPTNATNVKNLVAKLRANFKGTLTYDANHSGDQSDLFDIDWNLFNYGGISCYWPLGNNLTASWNTVLKDYIDPLHARFPNQTFACTEVGYRSVTGAHTVPWDYMLKGPIDYAEQADDYQALFDFLKARPYLSGVDFWNWRVDFNAQDVNETEFTPQKKLAQKVMTSNFTSQPTAATPIDTYNASLKGLLGAPTGPEMILAGQARMRPYQYGQIYWSAATGAHEVYGAILAKYLALGGSAYGLPTSGETTTPGANGRYNSFSNGGAIYWSPASGASEMHGGIYAKFLEAGGAAYGFPVTDETATPDGIGRYNHFTDGRSIYWSPASGAHTIYGAIRAKWASMGWERSQFGYPTTDELSVPGGRQNNFQRNALFWNASNYTISIR